MWFISLVLAAPIEVRVAGAGKAEGVQALIRTTDHMEVVDCNDAKKSNDTEVDGIWSCDPVAIPDRTVELLALVDGRLFPGGVVSWPEGSVRSAALQLQLGRIQASTSLLLPPLRGGPPLGPAPTVLARLLHAGNGPAPIMVLSAEGQSRELSCHDDGSFPDAVRNDGNPSCAAIFPASQAEILVKGEQAVRFPSVQWSDSPVHYLTLDLEKKQASVLPFEMPLPSPAPLPRSVPPPARPLPSFQSLAPWLFGLMVAGLSLGGLQWRRHQIRSHLAVLRPHLGPPLFPGGPSWAEAAVILRVEDLSFAAALVPMLCASRRLVLVLPDGLQLPPAGGAGAWEAPRDGVAVRAAVSALARTEGAAVAVLVVGGKTLLDPGAVVRDPIAALVQSLPPGVACWLVIRPEEEVAAWVPTWRVQGPPWEGQRLS